MIAHVCLFGMHYLVFVFQCVSESPFLLFGVLFYCFVVDLCSMTGGAEKGEEKKTQRFPSVFFYDVF